MALTSQVLVSNFFLNNMEVVQVMTATGTLFGMLLVVSMKIPKCFRFHKYHLQK